MNNSKNLQFKNRRPPQTVPKSFTETVTLPSTLGGQILWKANASGAMTALNPTWQAYTGMDLEKSLAWGFLQAIHPEDQPIWQAALSPSESPTELDQKRLGVLVCEMELRLLGADGIYRWMLVQAVPTCGNQGEVVAWQGSYTDIDRLKQTQLQLQEKQEFIENLIASCSEAIIAGDIHGTIQVFNQAAQELYGVADDSSPGTVPPWSPRVQSPGATADSWDCGEEFGTLNDAPVQVELEDQKPTLPDTAPLWEALQTEQSSEKELVVTPKTGKPRIILANSNPIFNRGGTKLGAVTLMRDITKRKQREQACLTLYAETQEQVRLLNAQLTESDRPSALEAPALSPTPNRDALNESPMDSLPNLEEYQAEFAELFHRLDLITPYDMAGVLWDPSGDLQGVMNCRRLLADSLWEQLEQLLLGAFPDQQTRQSEAVVWSIVLPEADTVPITELGSMFLFPLFIPGVQEKVGLLFLVTEGRSPLRTHQLGLLQGMIPQVATLLQRLMPEDSGTAKGDRPESLSPNSRASSRIDRENPTAPGEQPGPSQDPHSSGNLNHSRSNRDRSSAASVSSQPTREQPSDRPLEVLSLVSHRENLSHSSPLHNWADKALTPGCGETSALSDHGNRTPEGYPEEVPKPSESSPSPQNFPDRNQTSPLETPRGKYTMPPRDSDSLHDSVNYCRELEDGMVRGKRSTPELSEGPKDPNQPGETPGEEGILIYNAQGILITCNPSAERILGLSAHKLIGRSYQDAGYVSILTDGTLLKRDLHPVAVTFETGQPQFHTILGICKPNDSLTWIALDVQPLFDQQSHQEDLNPSQVIASFRDLGSSSAAEPSQEPRESEFYRVMVEQSKDLIARYSPEGLYLYASSASLGLLGYEPGELMGQSIYGFVHPDDVTELKRILQGLTEESPPDQFTYRHRCKQDTYIWVETTLQVVQNPDVTGAWEAIAISRDITPRKEKEEKTFALNHDLERLVRKQSLQLEASRQLKDELLLREQLARKVAEAAKTLLSTERQRIAESRSFLAEATTLLTASLDYQTTLENLAGLLVPRFADWCVINVMENSTGPIGSSEGHYRCITVACPDRSKQAAVWALQNQYPVDGDGRYGYLQQLGQIRRSRGQLDWGERENGTEYCFGITDSELEAVAQDSEHLELLRSLDCQAYLCLPIRFGDRTFGSILLMRGNNQSSARRLRLEGNNTTYSPSELSLAEDLVRRGAMTLEKALLYREAQETGEHLRQTVSILGERQRQLRTLQQLANLLNQRIADLPRLLQLMVEAVCEAIPKAQFSLIVLHDRQLNRLELMATAGKGTQNLPIGIPLKTKDSLLSQVFSTGQSLLRCHSMDGLTPDSETELLPEELPACVYAVPIESARAGRLGVLAVGNWEDLAAFEVEDLRQMVTAVGEQAAIAINNARSIEILEERDQLLQAQNNILACQNQELEAKRQQIERQNCQLREASRLKSEFLATMSHELRTPMNAILGFSQVLLRGRRHPLPPQQKQMVERILNNGKQLLALIDDILDLSKIEAGHSELKLEEFELDLLVSATCEELRIFAQKKNLTLQFNSSLENTLVMGDRLRLRQVVTNLVSNAIKFTTVGSVEVSVSNLSPDFVAIAVKDTGIGIPPEQLNHIFEAFRQGDQTTTREYSGTGLGLALSDSLVRLMKGTISVKSQLHEGSTFVVEIPRRLSLLSETEE